MFSGGDPVAGGVVHRGAAEPAGGEGEDPRGANLQEAQQQPQDGRQSHREIIQRRHHQVFTQSIN